MIFYAIITSFLLGNFVTPATGSEILDSEIDLKKGTINYRFNAKVSAPSNAVLDILSDYKYLPQLNKHIKSSAQKSRGTETIRFFKLEKCILNFCFNLNFEEEIKIQSNKISLTIIGDNSSFHFGKSEWIIKETSRNQTKISITGQLNPKFWIPPIIGVYFLDKVFNEQITETVKNIEKKAS